MRSRLKSSLPFRLVAYDCLGTVFRGLCTNHEAENELLPSAQDCRSPLHAATSTAPMEQVEILIRAMAAPAAIFVTIRSSNSRVNHYESDDHHREHQKDFEEKKDSLLAVDDDDSSASSALLQLEREQDSFSSVMERIWSDVRRPSDRYLCHLLQSYLKISGTAGGDVEMVVHSDRLANLLYTKVLKGCEDPNALPDPNEYCFLACNYLAMRQTLRQYERSNAVEDKGLQQQQVGCDVESDSNLLIRIFPYHNDVALRLWESGAVLGEFLLHNAAQYIQHQRIVELGAGVGLTGLLLLTMGQTPLAPPIGEDLRPAHVTLTDFTSLALDNLRYNIHLNQSKILHQYRGMFDTGRSSEINCEPSKAVYPSSTLESIVQVEYLEWKEYGYGRDRMGSTEGADENLSPAVQCCPDPRMISTICALDQADLLIAADVAYDQDDIPGLARTVHRFLSSSDCPGQNENVGTLPRFRKMALFATAIRNQETFALLEKSLADLGVSSSVVASGRDCEALPRLVHTRFLQSRKDVRICSLELR
jgi:Lysine methyltransferase